MIENLLGNAMIHGPAQRSIAVVLRRLETGGIRFEVRDQGPPLAPEVAAAIFRPFERRGPAGSAGERSGYGLGLAFCHLAVEAHGGLIGVEPDRDGGNCFYVELPGPGSGG